MDIRILCTLPRFLHLKQIRIKMGTLSEFLPKMRIVYINIYIYIYMGNPYDLAGLRISKSFCEKLKTSRYLHMLYINSAGH